MSGGDWGCPHECGGVENTCGDGFGSETARGIKIDDLLSQRLHDTPAARIGSGRDRESCAQLDP